MASSFLFLSPAEAARQLGVSVKALRLYEQRGLIAPGRTGSGWRTYGPGQMERAAQIVALRALGFSLAQVERVLNGDSHGLEPALAAHQLALEGQQRQLAGTVEKIRNLRNCVVQGRPPSAEELARLALPKDEITVAFDLPWPWGGERFELRGVRSLNYIIGPLGSGKTRLAQRIAEALPGAAFLVMGRPTEGVHARLKADLSLKLRVEKILAWLVEDGAVPSEALLSLLLELEGEGPSVLVIDMIEQGLDQPTQEALIAYLRVRGSDARPLFMLTRSSAILDLAAIGKDEAIILCPANHSPPTFVAPYAGAPGYEAVATCLATPEVRARTEGVIAWRPQVRRA
jgi:DNA-binding transcriptional MerR regulator